jgi:hypothetical protein
MGAIIPESRCDRSDGTTGVSERQPSLARLRASAPQPTAAVTVLALGPSIARTSRLFRAAPDARTGGGINHASAVVTCWIIYTAPASGTSSTSHGPSRSSRGVHDGHPNAHLRLRPAAGHGREPPVVQEKIDSSSPVLASSRILGGAPKFEKRLRRGPESFLQTPAPFDTKAGKRENVVRQAVRDAFPWHERCSGHSRVRFVEDVEEDCDTQMPSPLMSATATVTAPTVLLTVAGA